MAIGVSDNWQASAAVRGCCAIWSTKRGEGGTDLDLPPMARTIRSFVVSAVYRATASHTTEPRERERDTGSGLTPDDDGFLLAIEWPGGDDNDDRFVFAAPPSRRPSRIIIPVSHPDADLGSQYCWTAANEYDGGLIARTGAWPTPNVADGRIERDPGEHTLGRWY